MSSRPHKEAIVTTSWDDGHPLDLRVAGMLKKYGLKGTFYIPVRNDEHEVMDKKEMLDLAAEFEVGGHTVSHVDLTTIPVSSAYTEISGSKKVMEDLLGRELIIFAYPKGHYNRNIAEQVKAAGFRGARSASWFHAEYPDDLYSIHPTLHLYPHSSSVHIGHLIKELNVGTLKEYLLDYGMVSNLRALTAKWLERVLSRGGIFHIWGHSWEIEEMGLWGELEEIIRYISQFKDVVHLSNGEIIRSVSSEQRRRV